MTEPISNPGQIANDMAARARFWYGRDKAVEDACRRASWVIREYLEEKHLDGRSAAGAIRRIERLSESHFVKADKGLDLALSRAAEAIRSLRDEAKR